MIADIRKVKASLSPLNTRLHTVSAGIESELDFALLEFLMIKTNAPDQSLASDLVRGMPLSGHVAAAGSLRNRKTACPTSVSDLRTHLRKNNDKIIKNLRRQSESDRSLAFEMTLNEIRQNMIGPVRHVNEDDLNNLIMTPRFIVHQDKPRLIDNLKSSRVNETTSCEDTYVPDTLDRLICQIRAFRNELSRCGRSPEVRAFSFDFKSAYKHIAIEENSLEVANIVILDPTSLLPLTAPMLCQPFGSALSPRNWGRVVEAIKFLNRSLFAISSFCFVDDVFACEPAETVESAYATTAEFARILGFRIHKLTPPTTSLRLLGADLTILPGKVSVRNPADRISRIKSEIARVLNENKMSPALASSIRGKLSFAQSLLFGRVGRCHFHGLIARQYSTRPRTTLDEPLTADLKWWFKNLERIPTRFVPTSHAANHLVYSDASKENSSGLGTIIIPAGSCEPWPAFAGAPPDWLREADIFTLELLAAAMALWQLSLHAKDGVVLIFIDNTAAASALIRGTTKNETPRAIIEAFWTTCLRTRLIPWIEVVRSENNPADAPSRNECAKIGLKMTLPEPDWVASKEKLLRYCHF